jgi:S1-C subfamily serine protease
MARATRRRFVTVTRGALLLAGLVAAAHTALSGQPLTVLHIRAALTDAAGQTIPVARHALLISANPPSREPRRVVTSVDGTVDVRLRPGNYTVESDQPIAFQGAAYHWTQTVDVRAGLDSTLELSSANATSEALASTATGAPPLTDTSMLLRPWLDSVVEIWTPTGHGSGFLIDARGLIATNQTLVGDAASVEVQLARTVKVAGTVVASDPQRHVAVIRIDPAVMAQARPLPLECPAPVTPPFEREQEIFTLAAPLRQQKGWTVGTVTRVDARGAAADFSLGSGGLGGPVFTGSGTLVGITSPLEAREEPRRGAARIVAIADACAPLAAAAANGRGAPVPSATRLPVEPATPAPVAVFKDAVKRRAGSLKPYQMAAFDFDVTFITPIVSYAAQSDPAQTFGNWSEYVADIPPVLFIRVTPKRVETLWAKVARGAATTQGLALPPIKRLKSGFDRLRALCGGTEVPPIHPFKIELRVSETDTVFEGLYAFDPSALGPACDSVTLVLYSEKEPEKGDTHVVDASIRQQIRRDFELGASR